MGTAGLSSLPGARPPARDGLRKVLILNWVTCSTRGSGAKGTGQKQFALVFEYACNVLDLQRIVSYIRPDNRPSIGLAIKIGARRDDEVMLVEKLFDRYVWPIRITRPGQAPGG